MNTLKYKGYIGSVSFSENDGVFYGKIEGIDGIVRFEGSSIQELTDAFHKSVDDYLQLCKKQGIAPKKSYSGTLNIRISPATHNSIADYAAEAGITINAFIKRALEKAVENPVPSRLCEPVASYGSKDITQFWIPSEDVPLAKALAGKMGWEFIVNYPQTGLETALEEIREGKVTEYTGLDDLLNQMKQE